MNRPSRLPPTLLLGVLLLGSGWVACGGTGTGNGDLAADLAQLREAIAQRSDEIGDVEAEVAALVRGVGAVVDRFQTATETLQSATAEFERARRQFDRASDGFRAAAETYERVAEGYRIAAIALIVIAGADVVGRAVCNNTVSTRTYRQQLRAQGYDLEGLDVDHIIPRSLGGPDHPMNYQLLDSSLNRSLQAGGLLDKFLMSPVGFLGALAVTALSALGCG